MSATAPPETPSRDAPEALIEEAWEHARHRRRHRRRAVLLGGLAVATLLILGAAAWWGSRPSSRDQGERAARTSGSRSVHFLYTRATLASRTAAGRSVSPIEVTIENWVGSNGSWRLRETAPGRAPGSIDVVVSGDGLLPPQTNADSALNGVPINPRDPGDGLFTARQLTSLPADPNLLSAELRHAVTAQDLRNLNAYVQPSAHRAAQLRRLRPTFLAPRLSQTLLAIADLEMTPLPSKLVRPLYLAARSLPGVRITAGPGARGRGHAIVTGGGFSVTFDPQTGKLHAVSTGGWFDQGSGGTIVAQAAVPSLDSLPRGTRSVPSLVPRPPAITVTPHAATPSGTFTLRVALASSSNLPRLSAQMFGPTGPNCTYWASRSPTALIPPGTITRDARHTLATYLITPAILHHHTWCPGRYQLMLSPISPPKHDSTVPRSFAATYFTIN